MQRPVTLVLLTFVFVVIANGTSPATEPAVSGINGRLELMLGDADLVTAGNDIWSLTGHLALPVTNRIGAQLDLGTGEIEVGSVDADLTSFGLHLFTRNPELGLAGIAITHREIENFDIDQYGAEGEYYSGPITVAVRLAMQDTDTDDDLTGGIDLRWYPIDALMLETGAGFIDSDRNVHLGAEYQWLKSLSSASDLALSTYADLAIGNDDYDHALIGVRGYFGAPKSLARRHRQDQIETSTNRLK